MGTHAESVRRYRWRHRFVDELLKITKQHLEKMSKDGTVMVRRKESENPIMTILTYLMAILSLGFFGASATTRYVAVISNKTD